LLEMQNPATEEAGGDDGVFPNKEKDSFESKNRSQNQAGLLSDEPISLSFLFIP
jgi:hypothetical protein